MLVARLRSSSHLKTRWISCLDFHFRLSVHSPRVACKRTPTPSGGWTMAKRNKRPKAQKRRSGSSAKRGKARKVSKSARAKATKRTVARVKPKRAPVRKTARVQQPVAPVVETVAVGVIEQPAPGVISVTEVEETEIRKAS